MIRRALLALTVGTAAAVLLLLPPRTLSVTMAPSPSVPRGAMHIHTTNSDGSGTPDEVAAAAARAGLAFIILTDHGDAMRAPDGPRYRSGVLTIDAVEVSTSGGHVIALDLAGRAPYPLRGEPDDVLEDLQRLGAMTIVAHPTSPKADLVWRGRRPFDGVEWLNADSEWRDNRAWTLARILFTYWFRAPESLALMLDRPDSALAFWDRAARTRTVVGLGGSDAHAMIGGDLDHGGPAALHLPSYEQVFRTFSIGLPGLALSGSNAATDARAVIDAIRAGHVFTAIDAFAAPGRIAFTAEGTGVRAQAGDRIAAGAPVTLRAEVAAPEPAPTLTLYRDGAAVATVTGPRLEYQADGTPAVYRVEAVLPLRSGSPPAPWLVSNPIYVGAAVPFVVAPAPSEAASRVIYRDGTSPLTVEHSERSAGAVETVRAEGGTQLSLRYALGGRLSDSPFVAFAGDAPDIASYTAVRFTGRASRPSRVSVQLRASAEQGSGRWRRSVYLDENARIVTVPFAEFTPVRAGLAPAPPLASIASLLFVLDTLNTALGSNGEFWLDDVAFVR